MMLATSERKISHFYIQLYNLVYLVFCLCIWHGSNEDMVWLTGVISYIVRWHTSWCGCSLTNVGTPQPMVSPFNINHRVWFTSLFQGSPCNHVHRLCTADSCLSSLLWLHHEAIHNPKQVGIHRSSMGHPLQCYPSSDSLNVGFTRPKSHVYMFMFVSWMHQKLQ